MKAIAEAARKNFKQIQPWNLGIVKEYLATKEGFEPEVLERMEVEYKRFLALTLAIGQKEPLPISVGIDPMWHTHLLFSLDYTDMCFQYADGVYIHHLPAVSDDERTRLCQAYTEGTIPLYREAFGEPSAEFWPPNAQICIACCDRDRLRIEGGKIRKLII